MVVFIFVGRVKNRAIAGKSSGNERNLRYKYKIGHGTIFFRKDFELLTNNI